MERRRDYEMRAFYDQFERKMGILGKTVSESARRKIITELWSIKHHMTQWRKQNKIDWQALANTVRERREKELKGAY